MIVFQLDENLNGRRLASSCERPGLSKAIRFPNAYRGRRVPDRELLAEFMPGERPFVTNDLAIAEAHAKEIPNPNAGLIMIGNSELVIATTTEKGILSILRRFKERFPEWHTVSWRNSVVKLTEAYIKVDHIGDSGSLVCDGRVLFSDEGWRIRLRGLLERNAQRFFSGLASKPEGGDT